MIKFEINGKVIEAKDGAMVIEAADEAGIPIPRFCYHKKLSIAANCRMCLIEVEKVGKPLPACATPVTEGMKVFTQSPKAISAQKGVMEFLLINHPLDCPICDQGGECDLQDMAMGYGKDVSRYAENKRVVKDKNLGPLISTDMTRCIHCTRCVRFGMEIAGIKELGATGRGEHMSIGTYVEKSIDSELSGNVIDLCPVGALTSKPFRYTSRPWELKAYPGIAAHDLLGSNILVETRRNEVMRVLPKENEQINETWLSDRDRFSYLGLKADDRLTDAQIKKDNYWHTVDWETALEHAVKGIQQVIREHGAEQVGFLLSPSMTTEEAFLVQQIARKLGSPHIDHRLWQGDFRRQDAAPLYPGLGGSIGALQDVKACLLVGSHIRKDQPLAAHRLRKAYVDHQAEIHYVNVSGYDYHFPFNQSVVDADLVGQLAGVAAAAIKQSGKKIDAIKGMLTKVKPTDTHTAIAKSLLNAGEQASILLGPVAMMHPDFSLLEALSHAIAECAGAQVGYLPVGGNQAGCAIAGAVPHRGPAAEKLDKCGLDARAMVDQPLKAYVVMGVDPSVDTLDPLQNRKALSQAQFVVALNAFAGESLRELADVMLPVTPFTETPGTFVNGEGTWQSFNACVNPLGDSRPAWKVLRVLGNLFALEGFQYVSADEVLREVKSLFEQRQPAVDIWSQPLDSPQGVGGQWQMLPHLVSSGVDEIVRRSNPLRDHEDEAARTACMNEKTAETFGVAAGDYITIEQGGDEFSLPVTVDDGIPDQCVRLPVAIPETNHRGRPFEALTMMKKPMQTVVNE